MIRDEFRDLDKLRKKFNPLIVNKALNSAINKVGNKARTFISKKIRKKYNVRAASVAKALDEIRQNKINDVVVERVLQYSGGRISLINFNARAVRIKGGKRKAVSVLVKKSSGRKILKGKDGFGGFIASGRNGNTHVFMRETGDRHPLVKKSGPSISEMIASGDVLSSIDNFVKAELPKELDHALDYFLSKAGEI